jgi:signal transduction histidine kinase
LLSAQSNVAAIRSPAGEFLGIIAVILDISKQLRSKEKLRQLAAELAEADRRKDLFLATLAHELRNPLAPLCNGLQVMKRSLDNSPALEKVRAMMDRQLTQLVRLVDDLLDVSRITQGKLDLRKERIDLRTVVDAAVETCRPVIEQAGHELAVVMPDAPVFVDGDAARLSQVMSNLLNNATKYTHRGGSIRLVVSRQRGMAQVSVKDNGIGIPPAMLDKVFGMFTQVDGPLEKTTGGLGIGLSLVKGLLEMHNGTIEAKSAGKAMGSEFVFLLPLAMDAGAEPDSYNGLAIDVAPSALRRILVVDDNVDAADSLGELLEMLGNEVRTAHDGEAGVAVAEQFRPDVMLMDIGMPKLNGYEAARRIRQHAWGQGILLVALTGWGQEDERKKSADAGFDHHLVKPVRLDDLTQLISA